MNLIGSNTMHTDHNLHRNEIVDNFSVLASHHIEELQSKESSSSIPILSRSPSSYTISSSSSSTQSRSPLKQQTFDNETVPNLIANASSSLIPFDPAFRNTLNHHHPDLQENDEQQRNPNHRDQRDRNNLNDLPNNQPHENHQDENDDDDNNDNNENGDGLDDEDHEFNLSNVVDEIYEDISRSLMMGILFNFYKSYKQNSIMMNVNEAIVEIEKERTHQAQKTELINNLANTKHDIFGHSLNGIKKLECICPKCSRSSAASRLAPHLEKCLGMGRNSSRLASKRIALAIKNSNSD